MKPWYAPAQLALLADPIDESFMDFIHANPWVMPRLAELAFDWKRKGFDHFSMDMLFHQLRLEQWTADGNDQFKLNNSHTSRAARLLMQTHPELVGFFQTRQLRGDYL